MDIRFFFDNVEIGTETTGVSLVELTHDQSYLYIEVGGTVHKINCITADSVLPGEDLDIEFDGSGTARWLSILESKMVYDTYGKAGVPGTSAAWKASARRYVVNLNVTGPSEIGHEAYWVFVDPTLPPRRLKVVIKRRV